MVSRAAPASAEHSTPQEDALIDLAAFLVGLRARSLGRHLLVRRHQSRERDGRGFGKLRKPQIAGVVARELLVNGLAMGVHEPGCESCAWPRAAGICSGSRGCGSQLPHLAGADSPRSAAS